MKTQKEIRFEIADMVEKLGYNGCAEQIRANMKARENALSAVKNNPEMMELVKKLLPIQTEQQDRIYWLFNIDLSNELFHMFAGYGFCGPKEIPVNKFHAKIKYDRLKNELLKMINHSKELDLLFSQYEKAAQEEYSLYSKENEIENNAKTRKQYIELILPIHKQAEGKRKIITQAKIQLANYLMDNIKEG